MGAFVLIVLGATVLLGWLLGLEPVKSILPGFISMKVNTAIAFICAGVALALLFHSSRSRTTNRIAALLGSFVVLIGLLTLVEYVFHINLGIDELIFRDYPQSLYPGRIAPVTALNFCYSGLALVFFARSQKLAKWAQILALATAFSAILAIVGYAFGAPVLFGSLRYTSMALHTGAGFLVLSVALLCCQPDQGLMSVITGRYAGGWLSRRLIPVAVVVPPLVGAVLLQIGRFLNSMQMTVIAIVIFQMVLFVALTWVLSFLIDRSESQRELAEEQQARVQLALSRSETRVDMAEAEQMRTREALSLSENRVGQAEAEQIRAKAALSRSEQLLRQSQKMEAVGQLAAGIAHDFNNLLSVIVGYSEILVRDPSTSELSRAKIAKIAQAGQSAASLTRQLLAFSRQELIQPKVLDLNVVVTYAEAVLRRLTKEDVQFELTLASDLGPVKADQGQLEQILMNLVVNASDAMPDGGRLRIQTSNASVDVPTAQKFGVTPGPYVRLSVIDTGLGITPEVKDHMFEPFYTTKPAGKGTGLGLSTVYGIVKQNQGFIDVESTLGLGSAFIIHVPVTRERSAEAPVQKEITDHHRGATILVVEDDPTLGDLVCESLKLQGYKTMLASTGPEALHLCRRGQETIDVVITDVIMPDMNGRELVERLRALRPELKIIFMSGYTNDIVMRHNVFSADVSFIQKPFTSAELMNKIRLVLDGKNPHSELMENIPPLASKGGARDQRGRKH